MQLISCHNGRLLASALAEEQIARPKVFTTGLGAIDELLPHGGFVQGAIHEILSEPRHGIPRFFALLLARAASRTTTQASAIVWCDPRGPRNDGELYPPAVAAMGIPIEQLYLLHPPTAADRTWAIAECLRCRGVSATIAPVERLTRIEARRLQLAAEGGGGAGILLRPFNRAAASVYAAATRWLISPARGERTVQRWNVQLLHGHGGRVGQAVILEHRRETRALEAHPLHPPAQLADRSIAAATA